MDINRDELEDMFAKAMAKKNDEKMVQSAINLNDNKPKKEVVKLLSPDRWRNF